MGRSTVRAGMVRALGAWGIAWAAAMGMTGTTRADERPVHRFLNTQISPNGAVVASVEGDAPLNGYYPDIREMRIRQVRTGAATPIALPCGAVPQCWPGSPAWSPDSRRLSFTLRRPGRHSYDIYSVAADGTGLVREIEFNGTIVDLRYLPDGRLSMLATQGARKEVGAIEAGAAIAGDLDVATPEQRIAILEKGTLKWASPPDLYVYEYDWRPDGKGFVGTAAPGDGDNNWWTAKLYSFDGDSDAGATVIYAPNDIKQQLALPTVSRDGRTVAFIAGLMSDFGSTGGDVYTLPLSGGPAMNITPGLPASATTLLWTCGNHLIAGILAGERTQLVDLGSGAQRATHKVLWSGIESLSLGDVPVSQACPSGLTVTPHESFAAAPEIETGPLGKWKNLTAVNTGLRGVAHVQSIHWKSDGFDVQGWLLLPDQVSGKLPLLTVIHGGPAAATVPQFQGARLHWTLLDHGYALFLPNPRGSFGQGERFTVANVRDFGYGDLRDVLAGIDAAEKVAPIDESRLGITGGSYGGFMTMWAVTQTNRFKAAVAEAGLSNWLSYYGENGIDGWMLPYFGASAYDDPEVYAKSSPINFIRKVRTPTLAMAGERDIECPPAQTQEFWHALKKLNVPTSVMIYPGEGHHMRDPEHTADSLRRTIDWFDRYLK